mmetsp:Transcript_25299/g.47209  ORF Transcript_25299/g.47209 Transcript_25299/m.47209 type:complete len:95 (+) Transcript_25299:1160-1444(+)
MQHETENWESFSGLTKQNPPKAETQSVTCYEFQSNAVGMLYAGSMPVVDMADARIAIRTTVHVHRRRCGLNTQNAIRDASPVHACMEEIGLYFS